LEAPSHVADDTVIFRILTKSLFAIFDVPFNLLVFNIKLDFYIDICGFIPMFVATETSASGEKFPVEILKRSIMLLPMTG
jgi:hypothetical protein